MTYTLLFLLVSWLSPQPSVEVFEHTGIYIEPFPMTPVPYHVKRPTGMTRVTPDGAWSLLNSHEMLRRDNAI